MYYVGSVVDPELLPGSGSGTRKIQSWIRIRNKSFRIHITVCRYRCKRPRLGFYAEDQIMFGTVWIRSA